MTYDLRLKTIILKGLVFLVFLVPLVFSRGTTEVYGLIKWVTLELGVLLLLIFWMARLARTGKVITGRTGWAVLAFFCATAVSALRAANIHEATRALLQMGAGIGLYFLVVNNVQEKKDSAAITLSLVLAGVVSSLFSLYQNRGINPGVLRFAYTSTFGNPIFFAQYLSVCILLSVAMCLRLSRRKRPIPVVFFALLALLMLVFLILTRSRGAYFGFGSAFLYSCIALWPRAPEKFKKIFSWVAPLCLVIAVLGFVFLPALKGWRGERMQVRNLMRVYLWASTMDMVKQHPILGVGLGNFKVIYPLYRSSDERRTTPKGIKYTHPHNDFLLVLAETGLPGLLSFLTILILLGTGPVSWGLAAAMIALLTQGLFNSVLAVPASSMAFWLLLGLIETQGRFSRKKIYSFDENRPCEIK